MSTSLGTLTIPGAKVGSAGLAGRSLCTFHLADLHLGVPVTQVQEVMRRQEATSVPLVSTVIDGLINLRGEIVTAIDLRRRMGIEPRPEGATAMNVVIRTADGPVSLVVDAIDDVLDVADVDFEPPPSTLEGVRRELVTGVYKLERGLLLVLDLERVLDLPAACQSASPNTNQPPTPHDTSEAPPS